MGRVEHLAEGVTLHLGDCLEAERLKRHDEFYHIDTSDSAIGRRLHYSVGDDGGRDD